MKLGLMGLSCALGLSVLGAPGAATAAKPKVLVQELAAQGAEASAVAVISGAACQAFARSEAHEVLCGEDLRNLMRFGALAASLDRGCADERCLAAIGQAMKARYVVSGTVSKLGASYVLQLSMFDTETAKGVGRAEAKAGSVEELHADVAAAVATVLGKR